MWAQQKGKLHCGIKKHSWCLPEESVGKVQAS